MKQQLPAATELSERTQGELSELLQLALAENRVRLLSQLVEAGVSVKGIECLTLEGTLRPWVWSPACQELVRTLYAKGCKMPKDLQAQVTAEVGRAQQLSRPAQSVVSVEQLQSTFDQ